MLGGCSRPEASCLAEAGTTCGQCHAPRGLAFCHLLREGCEGGAGPALGTQEGRALDASVHILGRLLEGRAVEARGQGQRVIQGLVATL